MKVLVTGASGTIGSSLTAALTAEGHQVIRLVRRTPKNSEVQWNPNGEADPKLCNGADAVVHLAGESIAGGRWSARKKAAILNSRVLGTRTMAKSIAAATNPPKVLLSGSAIGFYGSRGDEVLTEQSSPGQGFLSEVCRQWEAETEPARLAGARVVRVRTGLVLTPRGGALQKMLPAFRLGGGGRVGSGQQWWSWIALDDLVGLMVFALTSEGVQGALNGTAPNPVTNAEFTRVLGKVLRRPVIFPLPAFAVRLAMGEMGEELLLASQRVQPAAAQAAGYRFQFPELSGALEQML
ncbi:MAG: TIGR01777 family oxidoreductase [Candidatus Korobacteraceae bacterium]